MAERQTKLLQRLKGLETGQLMDAMKKYEAQKAVHGWSFKYSVLPSHIRPFRPLAESSKVMVGTARTVHAQDGYFGNLLGLSQSKRGEVLVINGTCLGGTIGEIVLYEAVNRGLAGVLNIGMLRDSWNILHDRYFDALPIYADQYGQQIVPWSCTGGLKDFAHKSKEEMLAFNEKTPIMIDAKYVIRTGDIIIGDNDGIIVIHSFAVDGTESGAFYRDMHEILHIADEITQTEDEIMFNVKIRKRSLFELLDLDGMIADLSKGVAPRSAIKSKL